MIKTCIKCKKEYKTGNKNRKYCGKECYRLTRIGHEVTEETRKKIGEKNKKHLFKKGMIPWNKGSKGLTSKNKTSFVKGIIPWNKGKKIKIICPICGQHFNKIGQNGRSKKTCSKKCRIEAIKRARAKQIIPKESYIKMGIKNRQEKNINWKGENVSYSGLHRWLYKYAKRPDKCQYCGVENHKNKNGSSYLHWANISGKYKRDLKDFIALCPSCHRNYDLGKIKL